MREGKDYEPVTQVGQHNAGVMEKRGLRQYIERGGQWLSILPDHGRKLKRNDQMLEALPKAVIACPGNGINANLVDKAREMGIAVWHIEKGG